MTVYVDSAQIPATVGRIKTSWSHLTADTVEELNAFALRLDLRLDWFQTCRRRCGRESETCPHWHFDLTETKRRRALGMGAQLIDMRQMSALISARRAANREAEAGAS